jgi:molybdopterin converting factor small subunit
MATARIDGGGRACERRRRGAPTGRHKALLLTGPLAIAGVIAGAWGGSALVPHRTALGADLRIVAGRTNAGRRDGYTAPITVRVRLSSSLQAQLRRDSMSVTLPAGASVGMLLNRLGADYPVLAAMGPSIMIAVSGSMAAPETVLVEGETVELMSPYAGG